ncbi:DNA-protecting protein DprA [Shewanella sp. BF02_Schw]|uniref:DNA-processing protein DprA n=1 Tax=Shewanella sp. BF02_Schw TaxID=394908 RepID=UPI0017816E86|nr:DNA-protecting protein DprA [Shewanella sp. BF02_Schw]
MNIVDALALKKLTNVGDETVLSILKFSAYSGLATLEELVHHSSNLKISNGKARATLESFFDDANFQTLRDEVQAEIDSFKSKGVEIVLFGSKTYPISLYDLPKPPPFLYCKGNLNLLKNRLSLAVVGTRENTPKGETITIKTIQKFATYGFTIVSGLALGIDTIAHRAALDAKAPTISVLVDVESISPASNRELAKEILDRGGLLVAENAPGTKAIPAFFAKRDRIQAGLSTAVFAIETSIDGGTMHAVKSASSMMRPVFVPDVQKAKYPDLTIKAISGTQHLINEGLAIPYTSESYEDIRLQLVDVASSFGSFKSNGDLL